MAEIQSSFKRYEKKFVLTREEYEKILPVVQAHMVADEYGEYTISNIYYDTDQYDLIRNSIEKPIYKEKFRVRSYGVPSENDRIFAEIKKKYKGIVYKRRVADTYDKVFAFLESHEELEKDKQIQNEIRFFFRMYEPKPKVFIGYDRLAFAGKDGEDIRVTFDHNIRWRKEELDLRLGDQGSPILPEERIIMEVKVPGAIPLWFVKKLSEYQINMGSFSKYGTAYTNYILHELF
ncbi:MAG: polyphosphate polymerase domain-containing protein [Eubacterium sp.]|nr:polyphosphate polymerase domain-containing protein [Eubacterium sp.]